MNIIYAFCKKNEEGVGWARNVEAASDDQNRFVAFNYEGYLDWYRYENAVSLDRLYHGRSRDLLRMYDDFNDLVKTSSADAVVVCDAPPFHPEFLRNVPLYKVLYSHDDPEATYSRNIPYLHAYQHVFYVTPVYVRAISMAQKMTECGTVNHDLVPSGVLDIDYDASCDEESLFSRKRDIDVLFVGAYYRSKSDALARLKVRFYREFHWSGYARLRQCLYLTGRYRRLFWIRPVSFRTRIALHQRAKICINVHNGYDVPNIGNQRLFHGPANGAMLLSDGAEHLDCFYESGKEAVGYSCFDDLVDKIQYYLANEDECRRIARNGYRRVLRDYRFVDITRSTATLIERGMNRIGWSRGLKVPNLARCGQST